MKRKSDLSRKHLNIRVPAAYADPLQYEADLPPPGEPLERVPEAEPETVEEENAGGTRRRRRRLTVSRVSQQQSCQRAPPADGRCALCSVERGQSYSGRDYALVETACEIRRGVRGSLHPSSPSPCGGERSITKSRKHRRPPPSSSALRQILVHESGHDQRRNTAV